MTGSRAGYRERWINAVLWTDKLSTTCKLVCLAMSRHMDDRGRVRRRHADLAKDLQIKNPKRVGDRIKEARAAMFLSQIPGTGTNARVTGYDAMIPAAERAGAPVPRATGNPRPPIEVPRNRGPENRGPDPACERGSRSHETGDQYARVTKQNRSTEPAPDGGRGPAPHHEPKNGSDDEVPTTTAPVVTDRLSVPTAQQQADDVRANFEARGRALRLAVLGQEAAS